MKRRSGGKSDWTYVTSKFGRSKMIMQNSNLKMPGNDNENGFATFLFLDDRLYFDANFRATVLLPAEGSYGLCFRYIDQFNYYAF